MSKKYSAFLSHSWSTNDDGCSNHEIVSKVNAELRRQGISTWFDEERMIGNVQKQMVDGIDASEVAVVFISYAYIKKVAEGETTDNCCFELQYAHRSQFFLLPRHYSMGA